VPVTFEIKTANLPLVALFLKSQDLSQLSREWASQFGDMPDYFDQDPLVIDLSALPANVTYVDFRGLISLLQKSQLKPIAYKGGNTALVQLASKAGLVAAQEAAMLATLKPLTMITAELKPLPTPLATPLIAPNAMVLDKPLRSGQQIYAKGRDLVVLSMVNPGAEVIADGHIHVYAPLRGKAIAGAKGNADARIFSLCLQAELLSIAGVYRTSDVPLPADVLGKAAQVHLEGGVDGKLVMQALRS
jgi:septum site-determining protein MinC